MVSRFEQFSFAIASIYRSIQKIEREEMDKYGLKGAYAQYLVTLHRYPEGLTAARLCEICDLDKAAVSRAVADMEHRGLVERAASGDRAYRVRLCLTESGRAAAEYVSRRAQAAVAAAGQDLTEESRQVMYAALEGIAARLQHISRDGIPEE